MSRAQEAQPTLAAGPLEADDDYADDHDTDSAYGAGSETTSVKESVYKFRVENGRTYNSYAADCRYPVSLFRTWLNDSVWKHLS